MSYGAARGGGFEGALARISRSCMFAWHLDKARSLARKLKVAEPHEMNLASSTVPERELARGLNLQTVIQPFTTTNDGTSGGCKVNAGQSWPL